MPAERAPLGWPWPDGEPTATADDAVAEAFVTCFAGPAGRIVLDQLRRLFLDRRVAPSASDAELRHVEGQRSVVAWLLAMAAPERLGR
jgi:hypothetical protein